MKPSSDSPVSGRRIVQAALTTRGPRHYELDLRRAKYAASRAQVAELVDAQVSGTCGREAVEVRVFSWAPMLQRNFIGIRGRLQK